MLYIENFIRLIVIATLVLAVPYAHYRTGKKVLKIISIIISSALAFYFLAMTIAHIWLWIYGTIPRTESYVLWVVSLLLSIACFYLSLKTIKKPKIESNTLDLEN
ncbi:MAG: hypothetical protein CMD20_05535 [Flavobacteriales bacterium]|nr:hypothetical protein [Flavobacteriales bacterium]|tara:strand:- start:275 stop:589 length:315 start_codon:yes stop_codon:yes gene_type:complete